MRTALSAGIIVLFLCCFSATPIMAERIDYCRVFVSSETTSWQSSGLHVEKGQIISIAAHGKVQVWANRSGTETKRVGPEGSCQRISDRNFVASGLADVGLIAKIGTNGTPFDVGIRAMKRASSSGTLYFAINETTQGGAADNEGSWTVDASVYTDDGTRHFCTASSQTTSWQNSGIYVASGKCVTIATPGLVQIWANKDKTDYEYTNARGTGKRISDSNFVASGLSDRGLIAKIGKNGTPFNAGDEFYEIVYTSGTLYFAINETIPGGTADNKGAWRVAVQIE